MAQVKFWTDRRIRLESHSHRFERKGFGDMRPITTMPRLSPSSILVTHPTSLSTLHLQHQEHIISIMAANHGTVAHLLPPSYKRMIAEWLEEDCPSFDYG